jgi:hypothetical protein
MSIFNNPAVKYNYEKGNGVTLSSFNEPTSTISNVIGSAKVPKENVEGLEERFEKTEKALHSTINLTFEHGQKIDELNKQNVNRFAEIKDLEHNIEQNKDVVEDKLYSHNKRIDNNKLNLDVFKSAQNMINERHFNHIKKLTRESMIMFFMVILLFVIDLATIWCYIRK